MKWLSYELPRPVVIAVGALMILGGVLTAVVLMASLTGFDQRDIMFSSALLGSVGILGGILIICGSFLKF